MAFLSYPTDWLREFYDCVFAQLFFILVLFIFNFGFDVMSW